MGPSQVYPMKDRFENEVQGYAFGPENTILQGRVRLEKSGLIQDGKFKSMSLG
jgi:hypothetical protein